MEVIVDIKSSNKIYRTVILSICGQEYCFYSISINLFGTAMS
nr:MAG TPA: hypothetical protein [Bacteriophage sp.]